MGGNEGAEKAFENCRTTLGSCNGGGEFDAVRVYLVVDVLVEGRAGNAEAGCFIAISELACNLTIS